MFEPGSWTFEESLGASRVVDENGSEVCDLYNSQLMSDEIMSSGKLIAAAPDLMAGCEAALRVVQEAIATFGAMPQLVPVHDQLITVLLKVKVKS